VVNSIDDIAPIPVGTRLVHIGPPKTGTSALQGAFHHSRDALAVHGVEYAGRLRHSRVAMMAAAYDRVPEGYPADAEQRWARLAQSIQESQADRLVLSSETLAGISEAKIAPFLEAMAGPVHIVITLRPMASILASNWQQSIQDEMTLSYDRWLARTLDPGAGNPAKSAFWRRHNLGHQLDLWIPLVGAENITVLVLDPEDRGMLFAAFEALVGVPGGTLTPDPKVSNPSFPYDEIEMLRAFNTRFREGGGSRAEYLKNAREAVIHRRPAASIENPASASISTPRWAAEAANEKIRPWVEQARDCGVNVVGDLAHLFVDPVKFEPDPVAPSQVGVGEAGDLAYRLYRVGVEYGVRQGRLALREELRAQAEAERLAREAASSPASRLRRSAGTRVRNLVRGLESFRR